MSGRRGFGNIRRLSSGKYQVRYLAPDGSEQSAPEAGLIPLREFATTWMAERQGLSESTRERYAAAWRVQLDPTLGDLSLRDITEAVVRRWYQGLLDGGTGRPSVTKAYRLLRAILNTALDDDLIRRNPCR